MISGIESAMEGELMNPKRDLLETPELLDFKIKVKKAFEKREDKSLKLAYYYNLCSRELGFKDYNTYRAFLLKNKKEE